MRGRRVRAQRFEQVHGAEPVRGEAADRIAERFGDARLPGQVEHGLRMCGGDQRGTGGGIGRIERGDAQPRMCVDAQLAQAPALRLALRPVRTDHLDTLTQQPRGEQGAVLAAKAGDEGARAVGSHDGIFAKRRAPANSSAGVAACTGSIGRIGMSSRRHTISAADSLRSATSRPSIACSCSQSHSAR